MEMNSITHTLLAVGLMFCSYLWGKRAYKLYLLDVGLMGYQNGFSDVIKILSQNEKLSKSTYDSLLKDKAYEVGLNFIFEEDDKTGE